MGRHVKGRIEQPDQNEPFTVNNANCSVPSAFATSPDNYVAIDVIAPFQQVGKYRQPRGYRRAVNNPGMLRNDFVGQLSSNWNAPPYTQWARSQGTTNINIGGSVYQPIPSYDAQLMAQAPPPANRAAFTSAVQKFLATRGARANA